MRGANAARHAIARAVDELGHAVHDHVRAVASGRNDHRTERVVDDEREAVFVRETTEPRNVGDFEERVADGFGVNDFGARSQNAFQFGVIGEIDEVRFDAELGQKIFEQRICAAIDGPTRNDFIAGAAKLEQRAADRGNARGRDLRRLGGLHRGERLAEIFVDGIPMARIEKAAFDFVAEYLLHFRGAHERVGRAVGDRGIHVAKLAEHQQVLDCCSGIE